jgi:hypothetical protein
MKLLFASLLISTSLFAFPDYKAEYPKGPDAVMTPGSLCERPNEYRYPERIAYCKRDVDSSLKADIFQDYRNEGYRLDPKTRSSYKIDHLIPLCAGGSNNQDNLWPQHISVYEITDPMEPAACEAMKAGKIKQAEVVKRILAAKRNLALVEETTEYFLSLLNK